MNRVTFKNIMHFSMTGDLLLRKFF